MNKKILLFDDDKDILMVCKIILERKQYQVETRERCDNVIQDLESSQPDLVLMDLWIPEIGGDNAVLKLRANKDYKKLPVIVFSANPDIEEVTQRINANGYLKKPFDIHELVSVIEKHLN